MAGIAEQGVPFKKESIKLEEAAQTLSIGNLTWIECVVDRKKEEKSLNKKTIFLS